MSKEMSKAYEPLKYEDEIYKKWETARPNAGYFNPDNLDLEENADKYSIVLPPPNVTGTLHMGHAGMLAFEDILVRYHRMKGDRTLWVPGTDHAAIATQTKMEKIIKEEGTSRHELGRKKFLERVRQFASDSHDTIVSQCKKIGASLDWSREAYTLDKIRKKAVNSVFKLMYDDGLIYRGERIVNWCPRCHSTLADDEVEYKESKSKLYYFKYSKDFPITIATTRPETKLGDAAVAVNPKDERYKNLIGKIFEVDFVGVKLKIKVIADRNVDMKFGAGALGVTPAHSVVDWEMAQENDLEIVKVINEDGIIKEGFGEYSSKSVKEAREIIVKNLEKAGLMEKTEEIDNNLSICYRCGTVVEPLASLQWFIDVNKKVDRLNGKSIKEICLEAVKSGVFGRDKIKIIPKRFEKNYFHWMENLRDWCISRQIWFGHQVPVWYKSTINNSQLTINKKERIKELSSEASELSSGEKEIYVGIEAPEGEAPSFAKATAGKWIQDEDTLDTWFSSGLWTFSTLANSPDQIRVEDGKLVIDSDDFKNFHPISVLETGYDILFFWVARMIIMTTYAIGDIPFQDAYFHGLVLGERGKKMSKSKGKVINPLDMIKKYGADATRLSLVIGSTPGNDIKLNEEKIAGFRNMVNKIWNVARYALQICHCEEWSEAERRGNPENRASDSGLLRVARNDKLTIADKAILERMKLLIQEVSEDIEFYRFSQAGERLREFTWNELADWYIEASKFDKKDEKDFVFSRILTDLLKLWHPFIPFVTEVIWQKLNPEKDLIISKWPSAEDYNVFGTGQADIEAFEVIKEIIQSIRNARAENKIEPARKIKAVIYAGKHVALIQKNESLIKGMRTGIQELEIKKSGEEITGEIKTAAGDIVIYLIGAIDKEKEAERIKKEKANLEKQIKIIKNKLANKDFIERAPGKIVELEKEKLEKLEKELVELGS